MDVVQVNGQDMVAETLKTVTHQRNEALNAVAELRAFITLQAAKHKAEVDQMQAMFAQAMENQRIELIKPASAPTPGAEVRRLKPDVLAGVPPEVLQTVTFGERAKLELDIPKFLRDQDKNLSSSAA